ncbi:hypothetical protein [Streptomyces sp. R08]|uniref:Transposase n=1 Tax=Streptomyces sp. R08 TaxID=3238624 RepID=A0AB39MEC9_9ACTN
MTGPETIGREIIRLEVAEERDGPRMGKNRRGELETRIKALRWALNVLLTGDTTEPPGDALEAFLGPLRASEGGNA